MEVEMKVDGITIILKRQNYGCSIGILGDYCSNFGTAKPRKGSEIELLMEWEWGLTPKVEKSIRKAIKDLKLA